MRRQVIEIVIALALGTILGVGCNKNDNKKLICYLSNTDDVDNVGVHFVTQYIYNNENKVVASVFEIAGGNSTGNTITLYSYNAEGDISQANQSIFYTYDGNHNLTQRDVRYGGNLSQQYNYTYNSTGQLVSYVLSDWTLGQQYNFTYYYYYPNTTTKNPSSMTDYDGTVITEYEYDDRPNPDKILFPSIQPDNNITKSSTRAGLAGTPQVITFTYAYNADRYPTTRTASYGDVRTYTYDCK